ncbi:MULTISPECIES: flagellar export chaperone FliS [Bacillus]|uniref:flagellar export chaperone FliS n=1 Tax=Bacillus TaxID=1386 RepID=UPI0006AF5A87|nr:MULTISPECIES: flagellar export chaperone FliS [Bacillus]AWD89319.1 flagella export chaperone FliS [Bacillus velezensis]AWM53233.1 flagella export chaperone FliS [Bacillus amyloliquefaciens]KAF6696482.1 flagellar export chaperone FliS [Bacillus sp. EKM601B]KOS49801.1 flagellar biosynthesis protein FliS [Bacillus amyloliquefaciens]MBA9148098.1 flagellar export chaperone FliS [Bacillus sp. EKM213B]
MAINNPFAAYQQTSVFTAAPEELTLMLYNGCLRFIKLARQAMKQNNLEAKNENIVKAQNIIQELSITLNREIEISEQMSSIYDYIRRRLIDANVQNNGEFLDEAENLVTEFRDTWKQAMQSERKNSHGAGGLA